MSSGGRFSAPPVNKVSNYYLDVTFDTLFFFSGLTRHYQEDLLHLQLVKTRTN